MEQCTAGTLLPAAVEAPMRLVSSTTRTMQRVVQHPPPELTREAKKRLAWMEHYARHGNVSLTCRYFGIPRETFYYWRRRYEPRDLRTLESRPSRPHRTRPRIWTVEQVETVRDLRERYPRWGKAKLHRLLPAALGLSESTVGRILGYLRQSGQLVEPPRRISARKRRHPRPYATRKPKAYQPQAPGDLIQLDTLDVRPSAGHILKHFTACDVVSRWDVLEIATVATAQTATRALDALLERMPFAVRAIQVDGGSEFMAEFEAACQARGIRLFELPPRSPKLNGSVERAQRTHTEEFYECSTAPFTVTAMRAALREWEHTYNTVRPHQALGYLTPLQFWEAYQRDPQAARAALPQHRRKEASVRDVLN
jgi:putative transposase